MNALTASRLAIAILALFISASFAHQGKIENTEIEAIKEQIEELNLELIRGGDLSDRERFVELLNYFEERELDRFYHSSNRLETNEIKLLLDIALNLFYVNPSDRFARYMDMLVRELDTRHQSEGDWVERVYYAWLSTRNLEAANDFRKSFVSHDLPPTPSFDDQNAARQGPRFLRVDVSESHTFHVESFNYSDKNIIVVLDPFACAFSLMWIEHVLADDEWYDFFSKQALLLMPQNKELSYRRIVSWMQDTGLDIAVSYDDSDWSFIDRWAVPRFYILEEGDLVELITGWTAESKKKLERILREWD